MSIIVLPERMCRLTIDTMIKGNRKCVWSISYFLFFILISSVAVGQVFKIDSVTQSIKGEIPFDRPFIIQIPDKDKSVVSVDIWRLYVSKGEVGYKKDVLFGMFTIDGSNKYLENADFQRNDKVINIFMPPLRPNSYIEIRLRHKFRGDALEGLMKVSEIIRQNKLPEAKDELEQLLIKLEPVLYEYDKTAFGASPSTPWFGNYFTEYAKFFDGAIKSNFDNIETATSHTPVNFNKANFQRVDTLALKWKLETKDLLKMWNIFQNGSLEEIQKGFLSTNDYKTAKGKEFHQFNKRMENLKISRKFFQDLISQVRLIHLRDDSYAAIVNGVLDDITKIAGKIDDNLDLISTNYNDIIKAIDEEKNIRYTNWLTADNEVFNLKTKGTRHIIPEIGIASIFANGNSTNDNFVRPFAGASIYLRQIDKDVPLHHLRNSILHRLSFSLGLTVIEIKNEEFKDLYNKVSLLTGINFKLSRSFALSAGTVLFQQENVNPVRSDFHIEPRPYVGLSLDADFASGLKKITDKFGLK